MNTLAALVLTNVRVVIVGLSGCLTAGSVVVNIDRLLCTNARVASWPTKGSKSRLSGLAEHPLTSVLGDSLISIETILIN